MPWLASNHHAGLWNEGLESLVSGGLLDGGGALVPCLSDFVFERPVPCSSQSAQHMRVEFRRQQKAEATEAATTLAKTRGTERESHRESDQAKRSVQAGSAASHDLVRCAQVWKLVSSLQV